jgi:hypothetical protein
MEIIDKSQYSALVAAVIGSAVIPTVIANAFYLPRHLLPDAEPEDTLAEQAVYQLVIFVVIAGALFEGCSPWRKLALVRWCVSSGANGCTAVMRKYWAFFFLMSEPALSEPAWRRFRMNDESRPET